jgi:hypothetical protein
MSVFETNEISGDGFANTSTLASLLNQTEVFSTANTMVGCVAWLSNVKLGIFGVPAQSFALPQTAGVSISGRSHNQLQRPGAKKIGRYSCVLPQLPETAVCDRISRPSFVLIPDPSPHTGQPTSAVLAVVPTWSRIL